nr:hypothetical protein [Sphingomonas sp.]
MSSRIRCGARWLDARMVNVSPRGVGLTAAAPPTPGTYVEIRRGAYVIVARVVWTEGLRFGVHTQDPVPIDALTREPDSSQPAAVEGVAEPRIERRRAPRSISAQHQRSRIAGRALEFAFLTILAFSAAFASFGLIKEAFASPLAKVQQALAN